ncbi:MAG: chromosomal replication initiator protein DnaA [Verrucomicrobiia bacterium]
MGASKVEVEVSWREICLLLKERIPSDAFQRWFSLATLLEASEDSVVIGVPNQIYQFWIEDNYMAPLRETLTTLMGRPVAIRFQVGINSTIAAPSEESVNHSKTISPEISLEIQAAHSGLNPRYTFEAYVVGANNEMAHAAARAVASSPARTYNPLFIYGGVGLGKTHLMHAIGNALLQKKKTQKICYITSEQFTNEFIEALQKNALVKFRKRYRALDMLMIDDIQFLGGKERSQEEFFHTFNSLFDGRKQIVLTSDRPATEIANLQERLVSRFEWGMSAELMPPDAETRMAILRKKLAGMRVDVSDEILEFLATRIRTNVRRLEGALLRVAAYASLSGKSLTVQAIEQVLKDLLQEEARRVVTVDQIQKQVSEAFDLRPSDMTSKRRPANIALPRQVAMFLSRKLTPCSLQEIGAVFGGRDHGTVLHACQKITDKMQIDEKLRQTIQFLEQKLQRY